MKIHVEAEAAVLLAVLFQLSASVLALRLIKTSGRARRQIRFQPADRSKRSSLPARWQNRNCQNQDGQASETVKAEYL